MPAPINTKPVLVQPELNHILQDTQRSILAFFLKKLPEEVSVKFNSHSPAKTYLPIILGQSTFENSKNLIHGWIIEKFLNFDEHCFEQFEKNIDIDFLVMNFGVENSVVLLGRGMQMALQLVEAGSKYEFYRKIAKRYEQSLEKIVKSYLGQCQEFVLEKLHFDQTKVNALFVRQLQEDKEAADLQRKKNILTVAFGVLLILSGSAHLYNKLQSLVDAPANSVAHRIDVLDSSMTQENPFLSGISQQETQLFDLQTEKVIEMASEIQNNVEIAKDISIVSENQNPVETGIITSIVDTPPDTINEQDIIEQTIQEESETKTEEETFSSHIEKPKSIISNLTYSVSNSFSGVREICLLAGTMVVLALSCLKCKKRKEVSSTHAQSKFQTPPPPVTRKKTSFAHLSTVRNLRQPNIFDSGSLSLSMPRISISPIKASLLKEFGQVDFGNEAYRQKLICPEGEEIDSWHRQKTQEIEEIRNRASFPPLFGNSEDHKEVDENHFQNFNDVELAIIASFVDTKSNFEEDVSNWISDMLTIPSDLEHLPGASNVEEHNKLLRLHFIHHYYQEHEDNWQRFFKQKGNLEKLLHSINSRLKPINPAFVPPEAPPLSDSPPSPPPFSIVVTKPSDDKQSKKSSNPDRGELLNRLRGSEAKRALKKREGKIPEKENRPPLQVNGVPMQSMQLAIQQTLDSRREALVPHSPCPSSPWKSP